jgi:type I restriction enzyme, R subunit
MSNIGKIERISHNRVIDLFQKELGYRCLGNWEERESNSNVEEEILSDWLLNKKQYSQSLVNKVVSDFTKAVTIKAFLKYYFTC